MCIFIKQNPTWAEGGGKVRLVWGSHPILLDYKYGGNIYTAGNFDQRILIQNRKEDCQNCDNFLKVKLHVHEMNSQPISLV